MVIFHSYVSLPEGIMDIYIWIYCIHIVAVDRFEGKTLVKSMAFYLQTFGRLPQIFPSNPGINGIPSYLLVNFGKFANWKTILSHTITYYHILSHAIYICTIYILYIYILYIYYIYTIYIYTIYIYYIYILFMSQSSNSSWVRPAAKPSLSRRYGWCKKPKTPSLFRTWRAPFSNWEVS